MRQSTPIDRDPVLPEDALNIHPVVGRVVAGFADQGGPIRRGPAQSSASPLSLPDWRYSSACRWATSSSSTWIQFLIQVPSGVGWSSPKPKTREEGRGQPRPNGRPTPSFPPCVLSRHSKNAYHHDTIDASTHGTRGRKAAVAGSLPTAVIGPAAIHRAALMFHSGSFCRGQSSHRHRNDVHWDCGRRATSWLP